MASPRTLFTASRVQTWTYLLGVCPFSIAFLVFINSSISFVVTELIGLRDGEGDAVGTLGFADELLALVACPLWGVLSDRIGVRHVSAHPVAIYPPSQFTCCKFSHTLCLLHRSALPAMLLWRLPWSSSFRRKMSTPSYSWEDCYSVLEAPQYQQWSQQFFQP